MKKFFIFLTVATLTWIGSYGVINAGILENFTNNKVILENSYIVINGFRTTIDEYKKTHSTKIYGGYGDGKKVSNNMVTINGIDDDHLVIYGGWAGSTDGIAERNIVTINDGKVDKICGGYAADARNNIVNMYGGNVHSIYGGDCGTLAFHAGEGHGMENNIINIYGGKIIRSFGWAGSIIAGHGDSRGNTINIYNYPDLEDADMIVALDNWDGTNPEDNNSINVYTKGIMVNEARGFQQINFFLPDNIVNGEAVFSVKSKKTDLSGVTVKVHLPGNSTLKRGDSVYLLNNRNGIKLRSDTRFVVTSDDSRSFKCLLSGNGCHLIAIVQ